LKGEFFLDSDIKAAFSIQNEKYAKIVVLFLFKIVL